MEDCRVVLDYAKKQKMMELPTPPGKYQVFDLEKTQPLFAQGEECHGTAVNFFSLDLTKWAVPEQVIDREVAKAYGAEHYNPEQEGKFVHPEPVGIAVFGSQPGPRGTWRRITNDLGTFGFIVAWADVIRKKPHSAETLAVLDRFKAAALHFPVTFYVFPVDAPNLELMLARKSFEIHEGFRKKEEKLAHSGWQVCCFFSAAAKLVASSGPVEAKQDEAAQVCDFFKDMKFADTSEYKGLDKKVARDCLLVHKRVIAAECGSLLARCKVTLGPKNTFDGVHRLITISQKVAAAHGNCSSPLALRLKFVLEYLYVRMVDGSFDTCMSIRALKSVLSIPLYVSFLIDHIRAKYVFDKKDDQEHLAHFWNPLVWHANQEGVQGLCVCGSQPEISGAHSAPSSGSGSWILGPRFVGM